MASSFPLRRPERPERQVTGRTVLYWVIGFFAVIFAANAVLVTLALKSFPGLEVASSYKAGQEFNGEVAAAAEQAARGWNVNVHAELAGDGARLSASFADRSGAPERGLAVTARLAHPTDMRHDREMTLAEVEPGVYAGEAAGVGPGRWTLALEAFAGAERLFRSRNPIVLAR